MAEFKTKFSVGQTVWPVASDWKRRLIRCHVCNHTGKVQIGEEEFVCPKCEGKSQTLQHCGTMMFVEMPSKIGRVDVQMTSPEHCYSGRPVYHESYMIESTGVNSGRNWDAKDLFGSEKEAQAFCDVSNRGKNFANDPPPTQTYVIPQAL